MRPTLAETEAALYMSGVRSMFTNFFYSIFLDKLDKSTTVQEKYTCGIKDLRGGGDNPLTAAWVVILVYRCL